MVVFKFCVGFYVSFRKFLFRHQWEISCLVRLQYQLARVNHTTDIFLEIIPNFQSRFFVELCAEMHLEPCQTCKRELFKKIVDGFQMLAVFAKTSIADFDRILNSPLLRTGPCSIP